MATKGRWNVWWIPTVICAFIAIISFFQINTYWADQHNFNGIFGWLGIGIVFTILTLFLIWKVNKTSTGRPG